MTNRRRNRPPMPIEKLANHPEAMTLSAAGFGILMRLSLHFWLSECRPLPKVKDELFSIGRAHRPTWRRWKPCILRILAEITPDLERNWRARENRRDNLSRMSERSASKRALNALRQEAHASPGGAEPANRGAIVNLTPRRTEAKTAGTPALTPQGTQQKGFTERRV